MNDEVQINTLEAFNAAFEVLKPYFNTHQSDDLRILLSGMRLGPSGKPNDAATLQVWLECLAQTRGLPRDTYVDCVHETLPKATPDEWFHVLLAFVAHQEVSLKAWGVDQLAAIKSELTAATLSDPTNRSAQTVLARWQHQCSLVVD